MLSCSNRLMMLENWAAFRCPVSLVRALRLVVCIMQYFYLAVSRPYIYSRETFLK